MVNNAQLDQQEVKGGTLGSDASVNLTKVVNGDFGLFSLNLLALNLSGCGLGHFEGLNQRDVRENSVGVSIREILQQVRLKLSQRGNELVLLVHEFFLGLLEVGFLDSHDHGKKLVLKTRLSDDEVDDGALGGSLWLIVGVDKLGLQVELEVRHHLNVLGTNLNREVLALLDELSGEERVQERVNVLTNRLNHENHAVGESMLNPLLPLVLLQGDDHHV